jgi:Protein of unknown function (DUF2808)
MRVRFLFGTALATIFGISAYVTKSSQAVQLQDGTVHFIQPPSLVETGTTHNSINVGDATYYFTIKVPDNASEPLQKVVINQSEGVDNIRFNLKQSVAFAGMRSQKGEKLALQNITNDRQKQTTTITFNPAISPGRTVTIALKPVKNPHNQGVYLFGVSAFPQGEKSRGQFLGFARLQFYSPGFKTTTLEPEIR